MKYLPGVLCFLLLMQFEEKDKNKLFDVIPLSGAVMCVLSYLLGQIPMLNSYFFSGNGRLVGFFQYSNSFSLYLLIGIVSIANKDKADIKDKIFLLILVVGILLTGSRITFLLTLVYGIYQVIKRRKNIKQVTVLIGVILLSICIAIALLFITGKIDVIFRLLKISFGESTFIGRVIYFLDGLKILANNPRGIGYMGYSYVYPQIQTANYTVKFVHNDFLQQALDTGIISAIILMYLFFSNILSKKPPILKRELLIIMFVHMLFDFDMQFLVLHFIFVMILEKTEGSVKYYKLPKSKIINTMIIVMPVIIFGYFCVGTLADNLGNYELALELLPNKTSTNIKKMQQTKSLTEANEIADDLLKNNKYVYTAFKVKTGYALNTKNWKQMIENQKKAIELNKYDIKEYEEYVLMISSALEQTVKQSKEETKYLLEELQKINELLEQTKQETSPLAYKIVDRPELEMSSEIITYLEKLNKGGQ